MSDDSSTKVTLYSAPILIPMDPTEFWQRMRQIIKEEIALLKPAPAVPSEEQFASNGMQYNPLVKTDEVRRLFGISEPTVRSWCKSGKLKPFKVKSRVYFLRHDIQLLMESYGKATQAA